MITQTKGIYTTKPALQKIFEAILHIEEEDKHNNENLGKNKSHEMST
jgi:hypothetical protein